MNYKCTTHELRAATQKYFKTEVGMGLGRLPYECGRDGQKIRLKPLKKTNPEVA